MCFLCSCQCFLCTILHLKCSLCCVSHRYVRSMRTQTPRYPGSAMAALIDYIQRRDQEGVAAVAGHAAANTIPASNTRPNSAAYVSVTYLKGKYNSTCSTQLEMVTYLLFCFQRPLGPAISAFLSRRSLAPGELQAKMKKLIASQPAVQGECLVSHVR